jgi:ACS family tartrate transporter-like MFS transporter
MGPFWALVTATLSNTAAAGGIAFINSIGNLGGFVGPQVIAFAHQRTHEYSTALALLAIAPVTLAILVLLVPVGHTAGVGRGLQPRARLRG